MTRTDIAREICDDPEAFAQSIEAEAPDVAKLIRSGMISLSQRKATASAYWRMSKALGSTEDRRKTIEYMCALNESDVDRASRSKDSDIVAHGLSLVEQWTRDGSFSARLSYLVARLARK